MARSIVMPSFGMYTAEGTLVTWLKPSGAQVVEGEPVLEIETEKSTLEVTAPESGVLHHIAQIGARLQVESLIGYVLITGEPAPPATKEKPHVADETPSRAPGANFNQPRRDLIASPIARRLASEHGIDLAELTGSGPGGRITEADVMAALARSPGPVV
jgi:pyruvate/2-oxoglutarate dehydrogenase complex dihydrolipoamide acyltransferase (E2) component